MPSNDYFEVRVPQENVNDEHVRVIEWRCKDGERVEKDSVIAEMETSKTNFDLMAERSGVIHYEAQDGDELRVGALLATIGDGPQRPPVWTSPLEEDPSGPVPGDIVITAKAKKLMQKHGLTADAFAGLERIAMSDVLERIKQKPPTKSGWQAPPIPATRTDVSWRKAHEIRLLSMASQGVIPSSVTVPVDTAAVDDVIDNASHRLGAGITRGEWTAYCVSRVLSDYPCFNGYYDDGAMVVYEERHIGYALNLGKGLKVPVIRKAEDKDLKSIVVAIKNYALAYMRDELSPADLSQPTFSVTDLGGAGVTHFLPVIPTGHSAILGLCAPQPDASTYNLVLTFDHRMADGMEAAEFLLALSERLKTPYSE